MAKVSEASPHVSSFALLLICPKLSDQAVFDAGFWADPSEIDLKKHLWMYKKQREIVRRMAAFAGEVASGHPDFHTESKAAVVDGKIADIHESEYTPDDDKAIEKWLREHVASCWHSLGTCKMASLEDGGVVDPDLNVHGVQALKVADLSIPPSNLGVNTCNTAMAIGERAADIIIREIGIGLAE